MKIVKIVFINLLVFAVLLTLADPFLRLEKPDTYSLNSWSRGVNLREHPPSVDVMRTPPDEYLAQTQNLIKQPYHLRTNENGFIVSSEDEVTTGESPDIIFFGGSTTECLYVEEDKRFPALVGKLLSETASKKVISLNGGVSGNNTVHSTINLLAKGVPLRPKVVVLMHNVNDLAILSKTGSYWLAPASRPIIQAKSQHEDDSFLGRFSALFKSIKNLLIPNIYLRLVTFVQGIGEDQSGMPDEWAQHRKEREIDYALLEKQFEQSVNSFINLAKAQNINVVLMTQFNRFQPDDVFIKERYENEIEFKRFATYYKNFNDRIRAIADQEDVLLIDLDEKIPSDSTYIYDFMHLNTRGSELVAEVIAQEINQSFRFVD